jgi:hypothetical protein
MGVVILLTVLGVAILLILCFFAANRWSSRSRDREKSKALRENQQTAQPGTEDRATGIN